MNSRDIEDLFKILTRVADTLDEIKLVLTPVGEAETVEFYEIIDRQIRKATNMEALKSGSKKLLKVKFKDTKGREAKVDGLPKWQANVEGACDLLPAADGMSCELVVKDDAPIGVFKVQVVADSDLSESVKDLIGEIEFEVVGEEAVIVELTAEDIA